MSDAGTFAYALRIPDGTTPGDYGITAMPDGLDWCDDTGKNNRLDSAAIGIEGIAAVRASCAIPRVGFHITE